MKTLIALTLATMLSGCAALTEPPAPGSYFDNMRKTLNDNPAAVQMMMQSMQPQQKPVRTECIGGHGLISCISR